MTIQDLINELNKIEDKTQTIYTYVDATGEYGITKAYLNKFINKEKDFIITPWENYEGKWE